MRTFIKYTRSRTAIHPIIYTVYKDLNSQLKMEKFGSLQIVKNFAILAARNRIPFGIFYAQLGLPVI